MTRTIKKKRFRTDSELLYKVNAFWSIETRWAILLVLCIVWLMIKFHYSTRHDMKTEKNVKQL